jgi:16S rRNA (cytidine1402-2'-O)-methyltransferase
MDDTTQSEPPQAQRGGTLYIVPTPIGNLEDITLRALRVMKSVSLIAAEDTRTSGVLLKHYDIPTPTTSYHEHNKQTKLQAVLDALATGDVALISDAGTPGINDPGYELIVAAIEQGYRVEPLPGANAVTTALVGSGLPTDRFAFAGFLPKKQRARREFLQSLVTETQTVIVYESPNRLIDTLTLIHDVLGERPLCVARELTKLHEEFVRGTATEVLAHFEDHPPRGEITLLIGGAVEAEANWDEDRVREALHQELERGASLSRAASAVAAQSGWNKRDVYALGVES